MREQQRSMEQKTDSKGGDSSGGGNDDSGLTLDLANIFFKRHTSKDATLRNKIVRTIASFACVHQTFRLLFTCKEMLAPLEEIFQGYQLPMVCNMRRGSGKMFRLMVRTPNSRWLEWLATSRVKELKMPTRVTDKEMLIMFGDDRFSELESLNLYGCKKITDASVLEVARRCSNLQSLNLYCCENITDASLLEVARRCSNLQSLDLTWCSNITDAGVLEVARGCSNLQSLGLYGSMRGITYPGKNVLRESYPQLELSDTRD